MLDAITNQYRKQLISHCSSLPLDGLPAAGEMFYQRISLDDVFVPLRLSKPERTEELLEKNAEYYQIADSEINAGNTVDATDTHTANGIASKKKEQINRTALLSDPSDDEVIAESDISDFIDFLDAQIRKPLSVDNDELDVFLWQIDEQLKKLSSEESKSASFALKQSSASKDCLLSAEEPDTNANSISAQRESADSNMEAEILLREQRKKYECLPVGPVLDNYASRTVLLALPGCGKTTLAKRIALAYATGNIDCLESYHLPEGMVPLLLYCRSLNEEAFDEGHDFIQIAYKMFCNQFPLVVEDIGVFERMLNYHLEANKLLLIIDGLDEVLSVEKQELFAKRLLSYLSINRKAHLILTSRLASYVNDDQSTRYIDQIPQIRRNRILPMSMEQIDHFVRKWHDVLYPNDVSKRKNAESISVQLRQPAFKYLKKMIQIPLHLANIILVAKEYGRIPNDKVQLYEDYLKIALNWNTPGNIQSTDLKIALSYLAYHMTKTEHLRFDRVSLEKLLLKCSVDLDCELRTPIDENNVQLIIDQLEERTCVIQKHGQKAGYFEFSHKNLQEYLAAFAIPKGYTEDLYLPTDFVAKHYCMKNHLQPLRAKYISKYREHLMNPEKAKETVFLFSVCLMLGCWEFSSEAYLEEFAVLEVYYLKNRRFTDDAANCKMKMLRKQFSDMADPLSAGLAYHQYAEYEKAKAAFTIAYEHGNTTACNNLAYMLRRGEVDEVILENRSYTVEELLAEGIARKEPFSLVNYALYCSLQTTSFDYYKGLLIVKQIQSPSVATMNRIYTWWEALANKGDAEGYIVIAWLLELGLISDTSLGSLHELKTRIGI